MTAPGEGLPKDLTVEEFLRFRDLIHSHAGIYLEESKLDSLRISLLTRATRREVESYAEYFDILSRDEDEFRELLNLVTINETSFFRFPGQFEVFRSHVLPEIMAEKPPGNRALRVWSAGCSTGEEPYSIAITLLDAGIEGLGWTPHVLGTDVSTKALTVAQEGVYSPKAVSSVPEGLLLRYFDRLRQGEFKIRPPVRKIVDFGYHNLIKEPYPLALMGNWDIIFCRNVTIYFKMESTRRVVSNYFNSLNEGGYLFIGHSETLTSISDEFEPVEVNKVFLYRKPRLVRRFGVLHDVPGGPLQARRVRREPSVTQAGIPDAARVGEGGRDPANARTGRASRGSVETGEKVDLDAMLSEAQLASAEGRPDAVLARVRDVIAHKPTNTEARLLAAFAHADLGSYDQALSECHVALSINPLLPAARYVLGIIYQRQDDMALAVAELKKTIYIDPGFALAHLNLGNIYKAQHNWPAASREYENALRALYENPDGEWTHFMGGFKADLLVRTVERSLIECRKATGNV